MKVTIHKGWHDGVPPRLGFFWDKHILEFDIEFSPNCKYDLPGTVNDGDVNKLFGLGYLPNKGGLFTAWHHQESARFGWVYNNATSMIDIFWYCYINSERRFARLCTVPLYSKTALRLEINNNYYRFTAYNAHQRWIELGEHSELFYHDKKFSYLLNDFFGGNMPAPHTMHFYYSKK